MIKDLITLTVFALSLVSKVIIGNVIYIAYGFVSGKIVYFFHKKSEFNNAYQKFESKTRNYYSDFILIPLLLVTLSVFTIFYYKFIILVHLAF